MVKKALIAAVAGLLLVAVPLQSCAQDDEIVDESVVPFGMWGFIAPSTTFCFGKIPETTCYSRSSQLYFGYRIGVTLRGPSDEHSRWLMPATLGYFQEHNVLRSSKFAGSAENQEMLTCAGFDNKFSGAFISLSGPVFGKFQFGANLRAGVYGDWKHRFKNARKGGAGMISLSYPILFKGHSSRVGVILEPSMGIGLHNYQPAGEISVVLRPHIAAK